MKSDGFGGDGRGLVATHIILGEVQDEGRMLACVEGTLMYLSTYHPREPSFHLAPKTSRSKLDPGPKPALELLRIVCFNELLNLSSGFGVLIRDDRR